MTVPVRIQLRRTKGWRLPANTVSVARPTKWGNPLKVGEEVLACGKPVVNGMGPLVQRKATPEDAVKFYRALGEKLGAKAFEPLRGKNLACWCKPHEPCHADVLLALANPDTIVQCIACAAPFKDGDPYYPDASGGSLHAACCGPERESYTIDDRPLRDGEAIPEPSIWSYAEFLGQAATSQPKD